MWLALALLSAVFAALTAILAKIGIEGVNSHLATAIRTVVVLALAWGMVFLLKVRAGSPQSAVVPGCFSSFRAWRRVRRGFATSKRCKWEKPLP